MTPSPGQLVGIGLVAISVIVLVTLVLAFHYPTASDTTSVLGVALPVLTETVGAALGGGVGNAVGSAGKRSVQQDLTQANRAIAGANAEVATLAAHIEPLFATLKRDLPSPAGESLLMLRGAPDQPQGGHGIPLGDQDTVSSALARLGGLLQNAPTNRGR
jgi:hypothetical protein